MSHARIESGTKIGRYTVKELIGSGSQADVYRAYQESLNRDVALKILHPEWATDPAFLQRFDQEAKRMAGLDHPNLVTVLDYGEDSTHLFIAMSLVPAGSLQDLFEESGALDVDDALDLLWPIGKALDHAHRQGVVHRDVKPANILIDDENNSFLTDFGIAKAMEADANLTQAGHIVGTANYMSPEQCQGEELDGRSDLYSFAVVLFEAICGHLPFEGKNPQAVVLKHIQEPPKWPAEVLEKLDPAIVRAVEHGLAKQADERPGSCDEFVREIDNALRGTGDLEWQPAPTPTRRKARPARFFGSALMTGCALGSLAFVANAVQDAGRPNPLPTSPVSGSPSQPPQQGPVGPPPEFPSQNARAPIWAGPNRVAVHVDASSEKWEAYGADTALRDRVLRPLRDALEGEEWSSVTGRPDFPRGNFKQNDSWLDACATLPAELVIVLGMHDAESESISGTGFQPATFKAKARLVAHLVDASARTLVDTFDFEIASDEKHPTFKEALRGAVTDHAEGLIESITKETHEWRDSARERGTEYKIAVKGRLEDPFLDWFANGLRHAPGGHDADFELLLHQSFDPETPAVELGPGRWESLEEQEQIAAWTVRYEGGTADLESYLRSALAEWFAWKQPGQSVKGEIEGGWLVFEMP